MQNSLTLGRSITGDLTSQLGTFIVTWPMEVGLLEFVYSTRSEAGAGAIAWIKSVFRATVIETFTRDRIELLARSVGPAFCIRYAERFLMEKIGQMALGEEERKEQDNIDAMTASKIPNSKPGQFTNVSPRRFVATQLAAFISHGIVFPFQSFLLRYIAGKDHSLLNIVKYFSNLQGVKDLYRGFPLAAINVSVGIVVQMVMVYPQLRILKEIDSKPDSQLTDDHKRRLIRSALATGTLAIASRILLAPVVIISAYQRVGVVGFTPEWRTVGWRMISIPVSLN